MRLRVAIIFPHEWAAFSPTILNIVEMLSPKHTVCVFAIESGKYRTDVLDREIFKLIHVPTWLRLFAGAFKLYGFAKAILLYLATRDYEADVVIGVDSIGLYVAQKRYGKAHFLSLEIQRDWFLRHTRRESILSVAIQSPERLAFLFPTGIAQKTFIIPNSPISHEKSPGYFSNRQGHIVFLGNAIPSHGIYLCLEAIKYSPDIVLTIKGVISTSMRKRLLKKYSNLFAEGRIVIDDTYTPQQEIVDFLRRFEVGFCFYDFRFIANKDINYITSPSGKMYNYFSAGVPVIGSDIPGLNAVREYGAGVLLKDISANAIVTAIQDVRSNIESYRQGCLRAAEALDFAVCARPYLDFIIGQAESS